MVAAAVSSLAAAIRPGLSRGTTMNENRDNQGQPQQQNDAQRQQPAQQNQQDGVRQPQQQQQNPQQTQPGQQNQQADRQDEGERQDALDDDGAIGGVDADEDLEPGRAGDGGAER